VIAAPFRYRQLAWLVSAALAAAGNAAAAPAGNVDFAIGGVSVTGADGRARPAAKGQTLESGDRIVTTDGRAQIKFTDGAYVSLQPNTDFAIRDYRYDGKTDGSERGVFGLVRGALRTVTGAIGRVNRSNYQIQTPTATIGIRGTGGLIQVQDDGTTRVRGFSGIWTVTNAGGTLDVGPRQAAVATPNTKEPPTETTEGPLVPAPPPGGPLEFALLKKHPEGDALPPFTGTNTFVAGDAVNENGIPLAIATGTPSVPFLPSSPTAPVTPPVTPPLPPVVPLSCSTGCELSYATLTGSASLIGTVQNIAAPNSNVLLNPSFAMIGFTDLAGQPAVAVTQVETGTADNVVSWGRWTSATLAGSPWPLFNTLAYVTGLPSPIADLTATTGTFTFNFIGGTNPTDGTNVGTVLGGQVIGQFGPTPKAGISNFMYSIRGSTFTLNTPLGSELIVPTGGPYAPFAGTVTATATPFSECSGGCSATVNGHFLGTGATHAGFAYSVNSVSGTVTTVGAAAFKR